MYGSSDHDRVVECGDFKVIKAKHLERMNKVWIICAERMCSSYFSELCARKSGPCVAFMNLPLYQVLPFWIQFPTDFEN